MAANHDRARGIVIMIISTSIFTYFTFWIIIMPMVDADHPLQQFFPDRYVGLLIPFLIGAVCLTITTSFIGIIMAQSEIKWRLNIVFGAYSFCTANADGNPNRLYGLHTEFLIVISCSSVDAVSKMRKESSWDNMLFMFRWLVWKPRARGFAIIASADSINAELHSSVPRWQRP